MGSNTGSDTNVKSGISEFDGILTGWYGWAQKGTQIPLEGGIHHGLFAKFLAHRDARRLKKKLLA